MTDKNKKITSSFRDPSGFIFKKEEKILRQINLSYKENYDFFIQSGLFKKLANEKLLINHKEIKTKISGPAYKIIEPEFIPYISYPYEWSFSQLKDAALLTLQIQKISLDFGMNLKDATAYNIQFLNGKPILIDTLSFEKYEEGQPWIAYRQFCQHFLAPLALISHVDLRFGTLSKTYMDGIPLDLTAKLLPRKTKFSLGLATHIHLHAKSQQQHADDSKSQNQQKKYRLSKTQLLALLTNLESTVKSLKLPKQKTVWDDYYDKTSNYTKNAAINKEKIISKWISELKPNSVWDAGANDCTFSRLASEKKIFTLACDFDPIAVERAYLRTKKRNDKFLLPVIIDLTNPSSAIGWINEERDSFLSRNNFDVTFCLALVHHLAIANNLPFSYIAGMFAKHTKYLIIEFVPKEDSNTQRLLANREDIFDKYDQKNFEKEFSKFFAIKESVLIKNSIRTLYLMKRKGK